MALSTESNGLSIYYSRAKLSSLPAIPSLSSGKTWGESPSPRTYQSSDAGILHCCEVQCTFPDWSWSWQHRVRTVTHTSQIWGQDSGQLHDRYGLHLGSTITWLLSVPQTLQTCSCCRAFALAVPSGTLKLFPLTFTWSATFCHSSHHLPGLGLSLLTVGPWAQAVSSASLSTARY